MLKKHDMFSPKKFGEVQPKKFSLFVIAKKGWIESKVGAVKYEEQQIL